VMNATSFHGDDRSLDHVSRVALLTQDRAYPPSQPAMTAVTEIVVIIHYGVGRDLQGGGFFVSGPLLFLLQSSLGSDQELMQGALVHESGFIGMGDECAL
jgi:hypothetical protein